MRNVLFGLFCLLASAVNASEKSVMIDAIIDDHILPGFTRLAAQTEVLKLAAKADCAPQSIPLQRAWNDAFDAWIAVSHLRFGPTEVEDRAFALAFWPDTRGVTPRTLRSLIEDQDPIVGVPQDFAEVSIAARGFYALEFLLYDPEIGTLGDAAYRCDLVKAIAADIDGNADAILTAWQNTYSAELRQRDGVYRSEDEALQELFKALTAGLQFTSDTRLGRPMGTFERPRPTRAEAWRSGRSLRHVALSLESTRALAVLLSATSPEMSARFEVAYDASLAKAAGLEDLAFAGVATPTGRFRVEALQQSIDDIRALAAGDLGPTLGVAAGFNALDGD